LSTDQFAFNGPLNGGQSPFETAVFEVTSQSQVPDGGSSLLLLGMGLAALRAWKKRIA
jgi:hypothetical protein